MGPGLMLSLPPTLLLLGLGSPAYPKAANSCPCPCFSPRSFCDTSDAVGSELFDCSYSIPDPQLIRRIVSQVEFYLSDENLAKDAFLLKHVQKNKLGFVSIKLLTSFKKVGGFGASWAGGAFRWVGEAGKGRLCGEMWVRMVCVGGDP